MEKNHFEILLEHMDSKFDLVVESHDVLRQQIERLDQKVEQGDAHSQFLINALSGRVEAVRTELGDRIGAVEEKVDTLEQKVDKVDQKVDKLEQKVGKLEQKVDKVEQKVDKLEQKVDKVEQKIDGVAEDLAAHRRDTEAHFGASRVCEK